MRGERRRSLCGAGGLWSRDGGRRGVVAVLVALMLVVIIGFVSLGTEVVLLLLTSRHMQSAADAAALASETARLRGYPSDYTQEAFALSAAAGFTNGRNGTTVTVNSPPASGNYATAANAVEVLIAQPQTLALAQILYSGTAPPFTVRARSVAHASSNGSCTLTLDPAGAGALSMNGTTVADLVGCDASVNSTSATAVQLVGGASSPRLPVRLSPNFQASTAVIGKGFGCRRDASDRPGVGAGVRKPPKNEPAGQRRAVGRLWGFGRAAAMAGDGFAAIGEG